MTLSIDIPASLERQLRAQTSDLPREAKEAMLVGFYRQGKLTRPQLSDALGLSRFETDGILKKHNVTEDQPTVEEMEQDLSDGLKLVKR
jgi:hypothetical protein